MQVKLLSRCVFVFNVSNEIIIFTPYGFAPDCKIIYYTDIKYLTFKSLYCINNWSTLERTSGYFRFRPRIFPLYAYCIRITQLNLHLMSLYHIIFINIHIFMQN